MFLNLDQQKYWNGYNWKVEQLHLLNVHDLYIDLVVALIILFEMEADIRITSFRIWINLATAPAAEPSTSAVWGVVSKAKVRTGSELQNFYHQYQIQNCGCLNTMN